MKIKFLALAAMAVLSVGSAQAEKMTYPDQGFDLTFNHRQASDQYSTPAGEYYDNTYTFNLAKTYGLQVTGVANNSTPGMANISSLTDNKIFFSKENSDKTYTQVGMFNFDNTSTTKDFGNTMAGNYKFEVTGYSNGNVDGLGTISARLTAVSPVPEPETYAMLLAGLGLMGFMARRRKSA